MIYLALLNTGPAIFILLSPTFPSSLLCPSPSSSPAFHLSPASVPLSFFWLFQHSLISSHWTFQNNLIFLDSFPTSYSPKLCESPIFFTCSFNFSYHLPHVFSCSPVLILFLLIRPDIHLFLLWSLRFLCIPFFPYNIHRSIIIPSSLRWDISKWF